MDKKSLFVLHPGYLLSDPRCIKLLTKKSVLPLGEVRGHVGESPTLVLKMRDDKTNRCLTHDSELLCYKGMYCIKLPPGYIDQIIQLLERSNNVFVLLEGSVDEAAAIVYFDRLDPSLLTRVESEDPTVRLVAHDLPPASVTYIQTEAVRSAIYKMLGRIDPDLLSLRSERFLKSPHVLTHLFSHVMSLESADQVNYLSVLRVIADHIREYLSDNIVKIEKNHTNLWAQYVGDTVSFVDGGMSRIVALPGTEPTAIRVGMYSVIPGEPNLEVREQWRLRPYVIGDVLSDRSILDSDFERTDPKRLQEAARYILEPITALSFTEASQPKPRVVFLHGPIQNSFETYNELHPNYIPGLNESLLAELGITRRDVEAAVDDIPRDKHGNRMWNSCPPVYVYIMKRLFGSPTPFVGVVERGQQRMVTRAILDYLVQEKIIPEGTRRQLMAKIMKYEIGDELLFGCVLEDGEYFERIPMRKNFPRRAQPIWQHVISQLPAPNVTMLKCSPDRYPYRVELVPNLSNGELKSTMELLYHTSKLLPKYAFPVGIDIVDKYAKIPDWMSKGVSATLAANVLKRVMDTGDARMLKQVRQLLAVSPRDFFYRPKI